MIYLNDLKHTQNLACKLANCITNHWQKYKTLAIQAILFRGDLGSGKTTFTKSFVEALPKGKMAQISSPSFALCNYYKTLPLVLHADLYRCEYNLPDEVWEGLDNINMLNIIEWAEFLPKDAYPDDYLDITLKICENGRVMQVEAHGLFAERLLKKWLED